MRKVSERTERIIAVFVGLFVASVLLWFGATFQVMNRLQPYVIGVVLGLIFYSTVRFFGIELRRVKQK